MGAKSSASCCGGVINGTGPEVALTGEDRNQSKSAGRKTDDSPQTQNPRAAFPSPSFGGDREASSEVLDPLPEWASTKQSQGCGRRSHCTETGEGLWLPDAAMNLEYFQELSALAEGGDTSSNCTERFVHDFFRLAWPQLGPILSRLLQDTIQASLQRMPMLQSIVRLEPVDLTEKPPVVGPVYSYKRHKRSSDGLEIDMRLRWATRIRQLEMHAGPMSLGVGSLSLDGVASFILHPLIAKLPFIGGAHIFFMNPPDIRLHLTGVGRITQVPVLDVKTQRFIKRLFSRFLVLPQRIPLVFGEGVVEDVAIFSSPPPMGVMRVFVLEAKGLAGEDWHFIGPRTSDPYCRLRLGNEEYRTKTVKGTCHPDWGHGEFHDFLIYNERQHLELEVMDDDGLKPKADDFLGCLSSGPEVSVAGLLQNQLEAQDAEGAWFELDTAGVAGYTKDLLRSSIHLRFQYSTVHTVVPVTTPTEKRNQGPMLVSASIHCIEGPAPDTARGSQFRLTVVHGDHGESQKVSSGCRPVSARLAHGLSSDSVAMIWRLYDECQLPPSKIAVAIQPKVDDPEGVVREVIAILERERKGEGQGSALGWNESIYLFASESSKSRVQVDFRSTKAWEPIAGMRIALSALTKPHEVIHPVGGKGAHVKVVLRPYYVQGVETSRALESFTTCAREQVAQSMEATPTSLSMPRTPSQHAGMPFGSNSNSGTPHRLPSINANEARRAEGSARASLPQPAPAQGLQSTELHEAGDTLHGNRAAREIQFTGREIQPSLPPPGPIHHRSVAVSPRVEGIGNPAGKHIAATDRADHCDAGVVGTASVEVEELTQLFRDSPYAWSEGIDMLDVVAHKNGDVSAGLGRGVSQALLPTRCWGPMSWADNVDGMPGQRDR